jgi:hypothetical protein
VCTFFFIGQNIICYLGYSPPEPCKRLRHWLQNYNYITREKNLIQEAFSTADTDSSTLWIYKGWRFNPKKNGGRQKRLCVCLLLRYHHSMSKVPFFLLILVSFRVWFCWSHLGIDQLCISEKDPPPQFPFICLGWFLNREDFTCLLSVLLVQNTIKTILN